MIYELVEEKKQELKQQEKWQDYNKLKKEYKEIENLKTRLAEFEKKQDEFKNLKRYTLLKRDYLERKNKNYFKEKAEYKILINATDKKIEKTLEELNKNKRSRLFVVDEDFKTNTKNGMKKYKHYLIDNDLL